MRVELDGSSWSDQWARRLARLRRSGRCLVWGAGRRTSVSFLLWRDAGQKKKEPSPGSSRKSQRGPGGIANLHPLNPYETVTCSMVSGKHTWSDCSLSPKKGPGLSGSDGPTSESGRGSGLSLDRLGTLSSVEGPAANALPPSAKRRSSF